MKTVVHLFQVASQCHQDGDLNRAETVYHQILEIQPENADAYHLLGLVSYQRSHFTDAIRFICQATAIDPLELTYLYSLGAAYSAVKEFEDALRCYKKVLNTHPDSAEACFRIGSIQEMQEQIDEAIVHYRRACQINPRFVDAYIQVGRLLRVKGELERAVEAYTVAVTINPNSVEAYSGLGLALVELDKLEEAIEIYQRVISISPDCAEAHNNLGFILQRQNRWKAAIRHYSNAISADPNYAEAYNNLGNVQQEWKQFNRAIESYRRAVALKPNYGEAYSNLGAALQGNGDFSGAAEAHRCALRVSGDQPKLHFNYGVFCRDQGEIEAAMQAYKSAIGLNHDFADAHKNLGMLLLLKGDFLNGWAEYEWRWRCDDFSNFWRKRNFPQPLLSSPDVQDKSVLIWAEQGVGDQIMFISILGDIDCCTNEVTVECEERLVPLFRRSFSDFNFIAAKTPPDRRLFDQCIDYQIPIGNFGKWFRVIESDFCANEPYLVPCSDKTMSFKEKYKTLAEDKLLVGISWRSTRIDLKRAMLKSTDLRQWIPLLSEKNCCFINLQYGNVGEEIDQFTAETNIRIYDDEEVDSLQSLDDFAAQIASLDLIISTSNTTVHVAGALGKPVWNLLSYVPDWRWMMGRQDSPWYPTMKLFRQQRINGWDGVFQQVAISLKEFLASVD